MIREGDWNERHSSPLPHFFCLNAKRYRSFILFLEIKKDKHVFVGSNTKPCVTLSLKPWQDPLYHDMPEDPVPNMGFLTDCVLCAVCVFLPKSCNNSVITILFYFIFVNIRYLKSTPTKVLP